MYDTSKGFILLRMYGLQILSLSFIIFDQKPLGLQKYQLPDNFLIFSQTLTDKVLFC